MFKGYTNQHRTAMQGLFALSLRYRTAKSTLEFLIIYNLEFFSQHANESSSETSLCSAQKSKTCCILP